MNKQICAFSTADDKYARYSAVSLLSVRKWRPDIDLFIIGSFFSDETKQFLSKYDIQYIEVDLDNLFHTSWDYPKECYYIFSGPEILKKKGYKYSMYVDGDVYCHNDPINFDLKRIKDFAGAMTKSDIRAILGEDASTALSIYQNESTLSENRIQTGIVYFNNNSLAKKDFLNSIASVYQTAIDNNIPRKGDDSLLALFRLAYPDWRYEDLGRKYNFISFGAQRGVKYIRTDEDMLIHAVFVHFTNHAKPWQNNGRFPTYTFTYFYHQWRRHAIDSLEPGDLKLYFPEIQAVLSDRHLRFYWYPTKNVGDLITPYYLERVCGVDTMEKYSVSEQEIAAIEAAQVSRNIYTRAIRFASKFKLVRIGAPADRALYCVSTGSVIRLCGKHAMVYGSGIRSNDQEVQKSFVRSVRGPLTRKRFIDSGYPCPPIYGDPGLLLPLYYKPKKSKKIYSVAIIPHFTEFEQVSKNYKNDSNVLVIDMGCGNLEKVIDQIASAKRTISSSLHGLVLSHAYGIPTRQILYSDNIKGDGTKFLDYYMGVGLKRIPPLKAPNYKYFTPKYLESIKYEQLNGYDNSRLREAMFFDQNGMKKSAYYPYA